MVNGICGVGEVFNFLCFEQLQTFLALAFSQSRRTSWETVPLPPSQQQAPQMVEFSWLLVRAVPSVAIRGQY